MPAYNRKMSGSDSKSPKAGLSLTDAEAIEEGFSTDFRSGNSCCVQNLDGWIYHKNLN